LAGSWWRLRKVCSAVAEALPAKLQEPHATSDAAARRVAELVASGSIEMIAHRPEDAKIIADLLTAGTPVYVSHLPRHTLDETFVALMGVADAGLEPVPHLAARRIASRDQATSFLERAVKLAGVQKVLLVAGDAPQALGPYTDGAALLRERLLADCGVREVGLPGYPEGHPSIDTAHLDKALTEKLDLSAGRGLGAFIVTQFSFAPIRIIEYCADLARRAPNVPVYVGLAGPTNPRRASSLCKALRCQRLAPRARRSGHGCCAPLHAHRSWRTIDSRRPPLSIRDRD
jgi:5,10-methylenetetrahydrofolate reductase